MDSSCIADAPSTEHDSNGIRSNEIGDVMLAEKKNAVEIENTENRDYDNFDDQDTNARVEGPADLTHPNANGTYVDSGETEDHTVEQSAENSETCRVREDDDAECRLNASENNMLSSERSKETVTMQDSEQKGASEDKHAANKSYLVRVQSRSCDLRASGNSLDFHSARTSLQSKSFRASEPLQSKIMNTVDELKGDLSELFSKPPDSKPRAYPPRHPKQDGHMSRVVITSSQPLAAYHPSAKHSGHAARLSRSGQVAPRGLPSPRYRRLRAYSCHHNVQMEMRPCRHECCHSCQPPCYRSCKQEPAMHKPPVKEIKRRPPPRHHCRPVLRGAPFVICSNCLRLVQLPTDFAVPSRGTRRLQCGSCSEVLSYSYRDPSRKKLQSPFGGDEYSTDGSETHQAADGEHVAGFHQAEADPVSYSEEYGLSFGVSHSTSTEDGQPLYVSRNSSFNTIEEKMGRDGKLHRLIGYPSASELLRHFPDLFESFDGRTPIARMEDRKGKAVCLDEYDSGERDSEVKRSKARSGGLLLQGILKKGIHGLESLKLRS
uniref:Probable zinc-ribbon domain-containing protein n=1 Tax=Arundo donax TaxID=35708 RepID=A0A0A9FV00_ARUDO